jgi:cytochrome oxidase assembly protein ShyY1
MDKHLLNIEEFAKIVNKSPSTIRRHIKKLSKEDKNTFISYAPIISSGGEKILIDEAWVTNFNTNVHTLPNQEQIQNDNIYASKKDTQTPEYNQDKLPPQYDSQLVELLTTQIHKQDAQIAIKDAQILNLSESNKELIERLKEVNYTLANTQKQLNTPLNNNISIPRYNWLELTIIVLAITVIIFLTIKLVF